MWISCWTINLAFSVADLLLHLTPFIEILSVWITKPRIGDKRWTRHNPHLQFGTESYITRRNGSPKVGNVGIETARKVSIQWQKMRILSQGWEENMKLFFQLNHNEYFQTNSRNRVFREYLEHLALLWDGNDGWHD